MADQMLFRLQSPKPAISASALLPSHMAIKANHFCLFYFQSYCLGRKTLPDHIRHVVPFFTAYMIEGQNLNIFLATVSTRSLG